MTAIATTLHPDAVAAFDVPAADLPPIQRLVNAHAKRGNEVVMCALRLNVLDLGELGGGAAALRTNGQWAPALAAVLESHFNNGHVVNGMTAQAAAAHPVLCTAAEQQADKAPTMTNPVPGRDDGD